MATWQTKPPGPDGARRGLAHRRATAALGRPVPDAVTCERRYDDEEREFLAAAELHRERYHRRFLQACDYLHVLKSLGYSKVNT